MSLSSCIHPSWRVKSSLDVVILRRWRNVGGMTSRCSKISGSRHDECWCAGFESTNDRFTTVSDQGSVIESDRPFFTSTEPTIIIT